MADSNLNSEAYKQKALAEIKQVEFLLARDSLALCCSRAYFAVFYAMKAVLESLEIKTGSHKQTQVEFRKHFIKTGQLDNKFSEILTEVTEVRSSADYDVRWATDKTYAEAIVKKAADFVSSVLDLL